MSEGTAVTEDGLARLQHGYDLYNAEDYAALAELMPPDVVFERAGGDLVQGRGAVVAFTKPDAFEYQRVTPLRFEVHGDKVLVHVQIKAKGTSSAIELNVPGWHLWTMRDGVGVHVVFSFDEDEARARL